MSEHTVQVWGKPHTITVHKKSKTVWVAVGEYLGERHESKGRSETTAIAQWREWARYKGN